MAEFSSRSAGHTNVHDHTNDLSHINELSVDVLLKRDIPDLQMLYQRGGKKETHVNASVLGQAYEVGTAHRQVQC